MHGDIARRKSFRLETWTPFLPISPSNLSGPQGCFYLTPRASVGIGFETARVLANAGASTVVLACRNTELGQAAADRIVAQLPDREPKPMVTSMQCDLASLESIRSFAAEYRKMQLPLHCLSELLLPNFLPPFSCGGCNLS